MPRRIAHAAPAVLLAGLVAVGCGTADRTPGTVTKAQAPAPSRTRAPARPTLRVVAARPLPAAIQLPAVAVVRGTVLAAGGLDAADTSVATVLRVAPGASRRAGSLPQAAHDIGAAALGSRMYLFGGGTAGGPLATITAVDRHGATAVAGRLPVAMSDTEAVTLGATAYVIGGYTATAPLRSVLAFRPGRPVRDVATLPHPLRYAAAAPVGDAILVAGGTDGTRARDEILRIDPRRHRATVIGRLPARLAHAAGVTLGGVFYVIGGRGDAPTAQHRAIWAVDPATGSVRRAGRLPTALSDIGAVALGDRVLVVGGRDAHGSVHRDVLELHAG